MQRDFCFGVDTLNPFLHNFYLRLTDGVERSNYLAVEVRQSDGVIVDEVKFAYAAAGESFDNITAYTADTEDGDMGIF